MHLANVQAMVSQWDTFSSIVVMALVTSSGSFRLRQGARPPVLAQAPSPTSAVT